MAVKIDDGIILRGLFDTYLGGLFSQNVKWNLDFIPERDAYVMVFGFKVNSSPWHLESFIPTEKLEEYIEHNTLESKFVRPTILAFVEAYMTAKFNG